MAISLKTAGTWAELTADGSVTIPGTPAAGDRMFLFAVWKDFSITASVADWAPIGSEFADGSVSASANVGSVKVMAWYRDWQTGDGNPTIDFSSSPTIAGAVVMLWQTGAGEGFTAPVDATAAIGAATNWTATSSGTVTVPDGSVVMELVGIRDDSATMTRSATTALEDDGTPNVTWNGNYVEEPATHLSTTTGQDISADLGHRFVTTGASGVNLTATGTLSASETGAVKWVVQGFQAADTAPAGLASGTGAAGNVSAAITSSAGHAAGIGAAGAPRAAVEVGFFDYATIVTADDPVGYWRMGEPSGSVIDWTTAANHGSTSGTVTRDATGLIVDDDGAIDFDGSTGFVSIPDRDEYSIAQTGVLTIEAWFSKAAVGAVTILGKNATSNYEWTMELDSSDPPFVLTNVRNAAGGDIASLFSTERISGYGTPQHVVIVFVEATDTIRIYINGAAAGVGTTTWAGAATAGTAAVTIGQRGDSVGFHPDVIDEVAIYGDELDANEIRHHYQAGLTAFAPSPAVGTGTAFDATVDTSETPSDTADAGLASGAGSAGDISAQIAPTAGHAAGTGESLASFGAVGASAGHAVGAGAAADATIATEAGIGVATGTGTALDPSAAIEVAAGSATGAGEAFDATASTVSAETADAGIAEGTGTAYSPSVDLAPSAGSATGTGEAFAPLSAITTAPGAATGTGAAHDATVSTASMDEADAGVAEGTGTAFGGAIALSSSASLASGTGTAHVPAAGIGALTGLAAGAGSAFDATVQAIPVVFAQAEVASGIGSAFAPFVSLEVFAGLAAGLGAAYPATIPRPIFRGRVGATYRLLGGMGVGHALRDSLGTSSRTRDLVGATHE